MSTWEFGFGESAFQTIFWIVFGAIALAFVFILGKGLLQWIKNNNSPRLTEDVLITGKRTDTRRHSNANMGDITGAHGYHSSFTTWYYVTFQLENGQRKELQVRGTVYGQLAEGDRGKLTWQGTRFVDFERSME